MRLKLTAVPLLWLSFWVVMANFSFGGLYRISIELNIILILGLTFYWIGSLVFRPIYRAYNNITYNLIAIYQLRMAFKLSAGICSAVIFYLLYKFIVITIEDSGLITRQLLFGTADQDSVLFESKELALLYFVFVQSALKITIITGFVLTFLTGQFKYLVIGNTLCLIDSLLFLGRGALLEFVFQIIFFLLLSYELRRKVTRKIKIKIGFGVIFLIIFGSVVGFFRGDTETIDLSNFVKNQIVNYHTVGFVTLDQELADPQSRLNQNTTLGLATLGGIERLIVLVIRRFDKSIDSVSGQNGEYFAEFRVVGRADDGADLNYNAFATLFYTFLLDGGYLFVFVGMGAFGMWLAKERSLFLSGNILHLTTLYLLVQVGFNSVFFSPVESTTFWIVVIALAFVRKLKPRRNANFRSRTFATVIH
jgi:oligosaccharide repeat unit polymerase